MKNTQWMQRTRLLLGDSGLNSLQQARVLVVGMGGVGSYAAEMVVRAGIGHITIIDGDVVDPTNRNRQIPALATTHGMPKVEVMQERLLSINPEVQIVAKNIFIKDEVTDQILAEGFDYVIDAIDTLSPKVHLLRRCRQEKIPIVSSMGAAGKVDTTQVQIAPLSQAYNCTLARTVRKQLRKLGVNPAEITAVFTTEKAQKESLILTDGSNNKRSYMGTIPYLPAIFGCSAASVVIRSLSGV